MIKGPRDPPEILDLLDQEDHQELPASLSLDLQVIVALLVKTARRAIKETRAPLDPRVPRALRELRAARALLESRELPESQGHPVRTADGGGRGSPASLDVLARTAPRG